MNDDGLDDVLRQTIQIASGILAKVNENAARQQAEASRARAELQRALASEEAAQLTRAEAVKATDLHKISMASNPSWWWQAKPTDVAEVWQLAKVYGDDPMVRGTQQLLIDSIEGITGQQITPDMNAPMINKMLTNAMNDHQKAGEELNAAQIDQGEAADLEDAIRPDVDELVRQILNLGTEELAEDTDADLDQDRADELWNSAEARLDRAEQYEQSGDMEATNAAKLSDAGVLPVNRNLLRTKKKPTRATSTQIQTPPQRIQEPRLQR